MGFKGFVDAKLNETESRALAKKRTHTAILYIRYDTWGGQITDLDTILFYKSAETKDSIRLRPEEATHDFPKYIILKIQKFGFTEHGQPSEHDPSHLTDYFEPFERKYIAQLYEE